MEKPTVFTVFYSWQSDTPRAHCRDLIADALQAAADELSADQGIPYRVTIDRDTLNETGLCDIPATILAKIDAADAMVVDLTYVARTEPLKGNPKSCSNPNVLFELGYAFRSMDPKRLICVMNEKHGPKSDQIFDLNHRRHAIGYTSPQETGAKTDPTKALTKELVEALRPIVVKHGPRAISDEGSGRHAADRSQIEAVSKSHSSYLPKIATITCSVSPHLYQDRRWPDVSALTETLKRRAIREGSVEFPLRIETARGMSWGVYHDIGCDQIRWAMTYAGQFWCQFGLSSQANDGIYSDPNRPSQNQSPANLEFDAMLFELCRAFVILSSLANEFHEGETLEIIASGHGFQGQRLGFSSKRWPQPSMPALAPSFSRTFRLTSAKLTSGWMSHCGDVAKEICDLFTTAGNPIPRHVVDESLLTASQYLQVPPR
jgi:hypothetical protein